MTGNELGALASSVGAPLAFVVWMFLQTRGKSQPKADIGQEILKQLEEVKTRLIVVETKLEERTK